MLNLMTAMYTLIGDVVGSRRLDDRAAAQERIGAALDEVARGLEGLRRLDHTRHLVERDTDALLGCGAVVETPGTHDVSDQGVDRGHAVEYIS